MHVVIILGCGRGLIRENDLYRITDKSHLYYRLIKAVEVFNDIRDTAKIIVCSGGGKGQSQSMRNFLLERGIMSSRIISEYWSRTTIENCIFTYDFLVSFLQSEPTIQELDGIDISNSQLLDNLDIEELEWINCDNVDLYVVTNEYHLERSLKIFWYFNKRIKTSRCMIHGIVAKNPDNNPIWKNTEKNIMININKNLNDLKYWIPLPHDYRNRIRP